jgi:DNA-binding LacI/PurR family transcriptional regulator
MRSDKRPATVTMADVAQRAGVSRALVSIVFRGVPGASPATRERVMRAAEELAYRPDQRARLLAGNRSRTVGVVFGLHHEFHAEVVESLYQAVDGTGYDLALGATAPSREERRAVQSLLDYRCEALILLGPTLSRTAIEELAERLPVVVVARALRSRVVDVVRTDDVAGARLAVEHLAGLGHRAIVHVHGQRAHPAPPSVAAATAPPCASWDWTPGLAWSPADSPNTMASRPLRTCLPTRHLPQSPPSTTTAPQA